MKKSWSKKGRRFLNGGDATCLGAVSWRVNYQARFTSGSTGMDIKADWDAEFGVNKEGMCHWITRKGELRPLQALRTELDKFEEQVRKAIADTEEANGKT